MDWSYIIAPCIGGVIGYITNDIAIRMLFRPHTAKYLFGIHIPLTPGIIPKGKGRIAEAIGGVISENLMNQEVLQRYLLSEEMVGKVRSAVEEFINTQKENDETVEEFLSHYLSDAEVATICSNVRDNVTEQIQSKLTDSALGEQIAHLAMEHVAGKLSGDGAKEFVAGLGGIIGGLPGLGLGMLGGNIVGKILGLLREPAENYLAKNINEMLKSNGNEMVSKLIGDGIDSFISTPVSTHLSGKEEQLQQIVGSVESIYRTIITDHLPKILDSIDISRIVRERILEMDVAETEKLILVVMNKELEAIVWLGALLGMMMGCINLAI